MCYDNLWLDLMTNANNISTVTIIMFAISASKKLSTYMYKLTYVPVMEVSRPCLVWVSRPDFMGLVPNFMGLVPQRSRSRLGLKV